MSGPNRVLVCGSRDWPWPDTISSDLTEWRREWGALTIISGGAKGADAAAATWARETNSRHQEYPADWAKHGKAAGPIRNQQMLDEGRPDIVFAYTTAHPPTPGTNDMINRAVKAGIPVRILVARA